MHDLKILIPKSLTDKVSEKYEAAKIKIIALVEKNEIKKQEKINAKSMAKTSLVFCLILVNREAIVEPFALEIGMRDSLINMSLNKESDMDLNIKKKIEVKRR